MDDDTTRDITQTDDEIDADLESPPLNGPAGQSGRRGVRIIGAEPAGSVVPPKGFAVTEDPLQTGIIEGGLEDFDEPEGLDLQWAPAQTRPRPDTELLHWTDPPTGQVPAVLARHDEDLPEWQRDGDTGPVWRERAHDWEEDPGYEPAMLADDETRVGELRIEDPEETRPWEFAAETGDDADGPEGDSASFEESEVFVETPGPAVIGPVTTISSSVRRTATQNRAPARQRHGRRRQPVEPVEFTTEPSPRSQPSVPAGATLATERSADGGSGRNMPVAIATGVAFAAVTLLAWWGGPLTSVILATVVITLCAAEAYGTFRRSGKRSATLLGLVATVGLMIATYAKGPSAIAIVTVLLFVGTMLWYLIGVERGSPVEGAAHTVFVFVWVGVLGSFAALLLAPSLYPDRHGVAFFAGAIIAAVLDDVGSLAVGKWFGRHPLAAHVSPNKTWEGLIGGSIVAIVGTALIVSHIHPWTTPKAILLGVVVAVVAPIGDLCESLVKRELKLKDMGSVVPGHGGMLDRFDAILFVMPATYILVRLVHLG
jgi:phosphatidate cytidylyltransferase